MGEARVQEEKLTEDDQIRLEAGRVHEEKKRQKVILNKQAEEKARVEEEKQKAKDVRTKLKAEEAKQKARARVIRVIGSKLEDEEKAKVEKEKQNIEINIRTSLDVNEPDMVKETKHHKTANSELEPENQDIKEMNYESMEETSIDGIKIEVGQSNVEEIKQKTKEQNRFTKIEVEEQAMVEEIKYTFEEVKMVTEAEEQSQVKDVKLKNTETKLKTEEEYMLKFNGLKPTQETIKTIQSIDIERSGELQPNSENCGVNEKVPGQLKEDADTKTETCKVKNTKSKINRKNSKKASNIEVQLAEQVSQDQDKPHLNGTTLVEDLNGNHDSIQVKSRLSPGKEDDEVLWVLNKQNENGDGKTVQNGNTVDQGESEELVCDSGVNKSENNTLRRNWKKSSRKKRKSTHVL